MPNFPQEIYVMATAIKLPPGVKLRKWEKQILFRLEKSMSDVCGSFQILLSRFKKAKLNNTHTHKINK